MELDVDDVARLLRQVEDEFIRNSWLVTMRIAGSSGGAVTDSTLQEERNVQSDNAAWHAVTDPTLEEGTVTDPTSFTTTESGSDSGDSAPVLQGDSVTLHGTSHEVDPVTRATEPTEAYSVTSDDAQIWQRDDADEDDAFLAELGDALEGAVGDGAVEVTNKGDVNDEADR